MATLDEEYRIYRISSGKSLNQKTNNETTTVTKPQQQQQPKQTARTNPGEDE